MSTHILKIANRAFIFGGAYGNFAATEAIFSKAHELGFSNEEIIFTGDSVAYCANPTETAERIRDAGIHAIMGNCEEALAQDAVDCGCGFEEGSACDALSQKWFSFCSSRVGPDLRQWMAQLPKALLIEVQGFKLLCTHATPNSINQFVFPSNLGTKDFGSQDYDGFIVGHSGIPFIGEYHGKPWINSGASGMPANDGTARIWYATIEVNNHLLNAETHYLEYDYQSSITAMQESGLNNGYMKCLETGIWPSDDVLPETEKLLSGIQLKSQKKAFKRTPSFSSL